MEIFRTVLPEGNWDFKIPYPSRHFLIGSCFSEHMGAKLKRAKFTTNLNPFGILYHPLVISRVISRLIDAKTYSEKELVFEDDRYISFDHHGVFNHSDLNVTLSSINNAFEEGIKSLKTADYCYITWGSSFGYHLIDEDDRIVSNCHKIPSKRFIKVKSTVTEIVGQYQQLINRLLDFNPKIKIILSVSPVKHLREGLIDNNVSKAILLLAANELESMFPSVYYFPSFELLQDDLRDYRFYAKDMAHPNEIAVDYIWNYFQENLFDKKTHLLYNRISAIAQSLEHRPLHPENESYQLFKMQCLNKIDLLEKEFPFLDFKGEAERLEKRDAR